jgi:hypothetical protein
MSTLLETLHPTGNRIVLQLTSSVISNLDESSVNSVSGTSDSSDVTADTAENQSNDPDVTTTYAVGYDFPGATTTGTVDFVRIRMRILFSANLPDGSSYAYRQVWGALAEGSQAPPDSSSFSVLPDDGITYTDGYIDYLTDPSTGLPWEVTGIATNPLGFSLSAEILNLGMTALDPLILSVSELQVEVWGTEVTNPVSVTGATTYNYSFGSGLNREDIGGPNPVESHPEKNISGYVPQRRNFINPNDPRR